MEKIKFSVGLSVFTTGAFINQMCIVDENGNESWHWYVSEFVDDTYRNGKVFNPPELASSETDLMSVENDDE